MKKISLLFIAFFALAILNAQNTTDGLRYSLGEISAQHATLP